MMGLIVYKTTVRFTYMISILFLESFFLDFPFFFCTIGLISERESSSMASSAASIAVETSSSSESEAAAAAAASLRLSSGSIPTYRLNVIRLWASLKHDRCSFVDLQSTSKWKSVFLLKTRYGCSLLLHSKLLSLCSGEFHRPARHADSLLPLLSTRMFSNGRVAFQ